MKKAHMCLSINWRNNMTLEELVKLSDMEYAFDSVDLTKLQVLSSTKCNKHILSTYLYCYYMELMICIHIAYILITMNYKNIIICTPSESKQRRLVQQVRVIIETVNDKLNIQDKTTKYTKNSIITNTNSLIAFNQNSYKFRGRSFDYLYLIDCTDDEDFYMDLAPLFCTYHAVLNFIDSPAPEFANALEFTF